MKLLPFSGRVSNFRSRCCGTRTLATSQPWLPLDTGVWPPYSRIESSSRSRYQFFHPEHNMMQILVGCWVLVSGMGHDEQRMHYSSKKKHHSINYPNHRACGAIA